MGRPIDADSISTKLTESELRLRLATDAAGIGIWEWNRVTGEFAYSARARAICGLPMSGPITLEMIRAVTHPEDLPHTWAQSQRAFDPAIRENEPYRYRIVRGDTGELRWVVAHGEAIFEETDGQARAVRYIGTLQDITEEKLAQDKISNSEARLRLALEVGDIAVWEVDAASGWVSHSPRLNRMWGFPEDATPTVADFWTRYAPGERERVEALGQQAAADGTNKIQTEVKLILPGNVERWVLINAQAETPEHEGDQRVIGTVLDITDRKLAEVQQATVVREIQHRSKNMLAIVQSIANFAFDTRGDVAQARADFTGRISALAASTDLLFLKRGVEIDIFKLVERVIEPHRRPDASQFEIAGKEAVLPAAAAVTLSMAVHELCTNAVKYGALSSPEGRVLIGWRKQGEDLILDWEEEGGPAVTPPAQSGFGTMLLRGLSRRESGVFEFRPRGLYARLVLPLG